MTFSTEMPGGMVMSFKKYSHLGNIFLFSPLPGEMIQFDEHIFQMGWFNHQLVLNGWLVVGI